MHLPIASMSQMARSDSSPSFTTSCRLYAMQGKLGRSASLMPFAILLALSKRITCTLSFRMLQASNILLNAAVKAAAVCEPVNSWEWRTACCSSKLSLTYCAVRLSIDIGNTLELQISDVKLMTVVLLLEGCQCGCQQSCITQAKWYQWNTCILVYFALAPNVLKATWNPCPAQQILADDQAQWITWFFCYSFCFFAITSERLDGFKPCGNCHL